MVGFFVAPPRAILTASGLTYSQTARSINTANQSSYTFSSLSFGATATGRKLLIGVAGGFGSFAISGLTVAGNAATSLVSLNNGSEGSAFYQVALDSGTSGDVVVSLAGTIANCAVVIYRVLGAAASAHDTGGSSAADPATDTLNIPAGGAAFGVVSHRANSSSTFTWTNLDESPDGFDEEMEASSNYWSGAAKKYATTQTGLAITASASIAGLRPEVLALVSFDVA